jgi:hypothetical protein
VRRIGRGRKPLFWLLSSLLTLTFSGFLAVPAQAGGPDPGTIEICKSAKHGMAGTPFHFTLNGGAPFTVNGGGCSGPLATTAGNNTVVEAPTVGLEVSKIKAKHSVSKDLSTGTVVVSVKAFSTPADEALVTYTNRPLPAVGLKVCKQTPDSTLYGDLFSFTENGGGAYSVAAGPVGSPNCGPVHRYPLGTNVNVAELPVANTQVSGITVSDNRGSNFNNAAGTVTATIGAGVTVVTYTNVVTTITQTGFIEVCKYAGDPYVSGTFDFTITTASGFTASRTVLVGQCTEPIEVPAGNVNVAEAGRFPYYVSAINAYPAGRLVTANLANQTATVVVPKGDSSTETEVDFWNSTQVGYVKVCKTLTANSVDLAGKTFYFTVTTVNGQHSVSVVAGAVGTTACVIDFPPLPLGSPVSITEEAVANVKNVTVSVSPAGQDAGSAPPTANLTVGANITTATFTNQAFGTLEICKNAADASTATQTFQFSVNNGAPISVHAGQCSPPISVPAGTATVYELAKTNFHLVSVLVSGGRLVSGTNPVSVSVPFGGVANETVVTFTNAVNTGQFKICKVSSEGTLQGVPFHFTYSYTVYGTPVTGSADVIPGACSSFSADIPVVDPSGNPIPVTVTEAATTGVAVSDISVSNGVLAAANKGAGTATIYVAQGFTAVTYTNVRTNVGT